ncbi:MAG: kinase [Paucimonas sp.]|nr:kinase [Paucimonas sp.]
MLPSTPRTALTAYRSVAIIGKPFASGIARTLLELAALLRDAGRTVLIEAETAASIGPADLSWCTPVSVAEIGARADIAIVVGGDGTMLGIARQLAPFGVPLVGINQGRLGFMTDIPSERMLESLHAMLEGEVESEQRSLLEGRVLRNGEQIFDGLAFNDVVVARGTGAGMVELRVDVDGHFMYNQRSDGLIVATPTGSTAYALSAGGPLLHPSLGGVVLVPIAPHALSNRPIVITDNSEIVIAVVAGRNVSVNFDMQSLAEIEHGDQVLIRRSLHTITFLHPRGWSYYHTLREKLHWNEYPSVDGQLK